MRVILVGEPRDRARLKRELAGSGIEVVAELAARPAPDAGIEGIDAILEAPARQSGLGQGLESNGTPQESLTPREQEVLTLLADGLPNKAIAESLNISDQTVKFHVAAIIAKLGAANRTDAVRRAIRRGLVAI